MQLGKKLSSSSPQELSSAHIYPFLAVFTLLQVVKQTEKCREETFDFEKGQIIAHHHNCMSVSGIARKLDQSRNVIQPFLRNPAKYGTSKRTERFTQLTDVARRRVVREASGGILSSAGLVKAL